MTRFSRTFLFVLTLSFSTACSTEVPLKTGGGSGGEGASLSPGGIVNNVDHLIRIQSKEDFLSEVVQLCFQKYYQEVGSVPEISLDGAFAYLKRQFREEEEIGHEGAEAFATDFARLRILYPEAYKKFIQSLPASEESKELSEIEEWLESEKEMIDRVRLSGFSAEPLYHCGIFLNDVTLFNRIVKEKDSFVSEEEEGSIPEYYWYGYHPETRDLYFHFAKVSSDAVYEKLETEVIPKIEARFYFDAEDILDLVKEKDERTLKRVIKRIRSSQSLEEDRSVLKGENALTYAVKENWMEGLKIILTAKEVNVDARNSENYTPLMVAVIEEKTEMAELLLDAGANPNAKRESYQVIDLITGEKSEIYDLLSARGGVSYGGGSSSSGGSGSSFAMITGQYRDWVLGTYTGEINPRHINDTFFVEGYEKMTVLGYAILKEKVELVSLLLEMGADPNLKVEKSKAVSQGYRTFKQTPLTLAVAKGNIEVVEVLAQAEKIDREAYSSDVIKTSRNGMMVSSLEYTPLSLAASAVKVEMVSVLIKAGVDPTSLIVQKKWTMHGGKHYLTQEATWDAIGFAEVMIRKGNEKSGAYSDVIKAVRGPHPYLVGSFTLASRELKTRTSWGRKIEDGVGPWEKESGVFRP